MFGRFFQTRSGTSASGMMPSGLLRASLRRWAMDLGSNSDSEKLMASRLACISVFRFGERMASRVKVAML
ncbi:Uncharacterised protein [Mycobacteroides abscessus subsp. abscessus]|nr:Uncharacterised protein [Mycobacteroides abscessus subsp. abscessus]